MVSAEKQPESLHKRLNIQVQKNKTINHQYYCWVVLAVSSSTDNLK